ncbi:glucosamine--fructose-6-phosphate aminotransferase (isomerizing) [Nocardioides cavernae]|uniref:Glucosamine--fructose-6-phosphate aminotransferase (Isomerizing) n=1 Tax=Nocardioides cavernae TaxID=1921566 RepID=A0A7Y9H0M9_9ACTN|nr:SIS domain-containing protein [Nocardioides cavernae]NYE35446.1 glucosamine--fructose-6-phosphate aminotransferase (isomerizing) [Nocardioides cavernae]
MSSTTPATSDRTATRMAAEIAEQPDAARRTIEHLMAEQPRLRALSEGRRRVLLVARGSSDNAAIYGRYLLEVHAGIPGALAAPSVATHYRASLDLGDSVVVSVSQSGATAEIVETQEWARSCGATTVAVTNVAGSPLADAADVALVTQAGPEVAVPATKTYLTQLVALAVLADAWADGPSLADDLARVPDAVAGLLEADVAPAAEALAAADRVVVSGRGLLLGTALETALKMEETCLRPVRGYSYADLRHGPISVVSEGLLAVLVASAGGPLAEPMADLVRDLQERGARVLGIGGTADFAGRCDLHLAGPDLPETVEPLASIVPSQMMIEQMARRLGLDPDNPRGLNKVTQTEFTS